MKKLIVLSVVQLAFGISAFAAMDGSDVPACKGVTDVCMAADVSAVDSTTGQTVKGYIAGEHKKDGHGLWADCVAPLAHGKTVQGVSGVSQTAAKACAQAFHAAHPHNK